MGKLTEYEKCVRKAARCINSAWILAPHVTMNDVVLAVFHETQKQRCEPNSTLRATIEFLKTGG